MIESSFLGLVQGLTEFLPVSSSGHLALVQIFFGWREESFIFDIAVHFATMMATIIYFRTMILEILADWFGGLFYRDRRKTEGWILGWAIIAGNCMTVPVALLLKPLVQKWMLSTIAVGAALLVTSMVLWYAVSIREKGKGVSLKRSLFIGFIQGLAVIPGISRSGVTIVAGLRSGFSAERAFSFSFLLSLPAIFGATLLEFRDISGNPESLSSMPTGWLAGTVTAFVSGYFALAVLRKVVTMGKWKGFAIYCALVGAFCVFSGLLKGV